MTTSSSPHGADAIEKYVAAFTTASDESTAALGQVLADEVTFVGPRGRASGRGDVLTAVMNPMLAGLLAGAEWSEPRPDGDSVVVRATLAPGSPLGGIAATISVDPAGRISRIIQEVMPASPPAAQPLTLDDAITAAVNGALSNGTPIVVAYVDGDGAPHLSLRGSTHVHGTDQLAIWNRDPKGGMGRALESNPNVALFYRDPGTQTSYAFSGRARVETDPVTRQRVYNESAEQERNLDPMCRGLAVIIDLDRVEGGTFGNRVVLQRA